MKKLLFILILSIVLTGCGVAERFNDFLESLTISGGDHQVQDVTVYFYDQTGETNKAVVTFDKPYYVDLENVSDWLFILDGLAFNIGYISVKCEDGESVSQDYTQGVIQ